MPVEGTYDFNWGYDGVNKYAVSRALGDNKSKQDAIARNNLLKEVVDYCHQNNLNVGLDWVPSHIPTCDSQRGATISDIGYNLYQFAPYESDRPGEWGGKHFNLEAPNLAVRENVRDYVANIPLHFIDNYHIDFLRGDMSPKMYSNNAMKQIAAEVRHHFHSYFYCLGR
ncbi:MAG: hypothetical protein MZU91_05575 [Desulfosudis oleivorans]|nr:hypothetical protein [Desulfosudis oleivorans]